MQCNLLDNKPNGVMFPSDFVELSEQTMRVIGDLAVVSLVDMVWFRKLPQAPVETEKSTSGLDPGSPLVLEI